MSGKYGRAEPVGGPLWTPAFRLLSAFIVIAMLLIAARFAFGIGATSALNDGYAWGAWKILNVVVFTALGSGGYAMALLVYVLNRGHYHPMVRHALLTSAVGYSTAVLALGVDIGRPWNFWRMGDITGWNFHSVLLEVAICVTLYVGFLWIEMAPPILETWKKRPHGRLKEIALRVTPKLETAFPWLIAAALLLPSMHQSSLGSLYLLAGPWLHELWQTPFLPLLFLLSCYVLGFAAVVITSLLASLRWKRPMQFGMLARLSRAMAGVLILFLVLRVGDLVWRGATGSVLAMDRYGTFFLLESGLLLAAAVGLLSERVRSRPDSLFRMAVLIVMGGSLYRLNASILGFMPGGHWSYFPSVPELLISFGFIAMSVWGYVFMIKRFPILEAAPQLQPVAIPVPVLPQSTHHHDHRLQEETHV
jgi:Ni/Fe-hydrogenase subunit HybB-like protein